MAHGSAPYSPEHAGATPLRLALFTGNYNHIADGVSLTLNRLVAFLERHGAAVRVFAPTVENPPIRHNGTLIPVPSIPAPGRPEYRLAKQLTPALQEELKAFGPTLFHVATPDWLGYGALRLARKWQVPAVCSFHTAFASYLKYYHLTWLEGLLWRYGRHFYAMCEEVYVPTPSIAALLRKNGIAARTRLWPRGVDPALFNPAHRSLEWRRSLGIGDDEVVVSFISRLVWEKGLRVYAEVIEGLKARGLPHRGLIVGDGPVRAELEKRLPGTLFTGHLDGQALARAYASSDVFVFPSATETFGNVTLEAMASGLPTVCADAPGSDTLVVHGETGYLAPVGQSQAFLEYVSHLVDDDAARHRMGAAALARAQTYDWDAVLALILGYYQEVLNPGLPRATGPLRVDAHPACSP